MDYLNAFDDNCRSGWTSDYVSRLSARHVDEFQIGISPSKKQIRDNSLRKTRNILLHNFKSTPIGENNLHDPRTVPGKVQYTDHNHGIVVPCSWSDAFLNNLVSCN